MVTDSLTDCVGFKAFQPSRPNPNLAKLMRVMHMEVAKVADMVIDMEVDKVADMVVNVPDEDFSDTYLTMVIFMEMSYE